MLVSQSIARDAPVFVSKPSVQVSQASAAQPAVIVDIGRASAASKPVEPANQQVNDVLSNISATNAFIDDFNNQIDWKVVASIAGTAMANQERNGMIKALTGDENSLALRAGQLGIPVQVSAPTNGGSSSGLSSISVAAFTFTDSGSTYAVTPSTAGTLVGTKDGQAWATWNIGGQSAGRSSGDKDANAALQTLTSAAKAASARKSTLLASKLNVAV